MENVKNGWFVNLSFVKIETVKSEKWTISGPVDPRSNDDSNSKRRE